MDPPEDKPIDASLNIALGVHPRKRAMVDSSHDRNQKSTTKRQRTLKTKSTR